MSPFSFPFSFPSLSLVPLCENYLHYSFVYSLRLSSSILAVDPVTSLRYWAPTPDPSPGSNKPAKPTLLLLHGFGPTSSSLYQFPIALLHSLLPYFHLIIPDLLFFHPSSTTSSAERAETFQATSVINLMNKLGVEKFNVLGTSYGGFVAYHMAKMCGARVDKVIIASSGVNMRRKNNEELAKRAGVDSVEEVLMPETTGRLRKLIELAVWNKKVARAVPDFILNDFINVST